MCPANHNKTNGFTLIELLATIAILSVLVGTAVVYVPQYINWAKQTANKQTLAVLNDALTRYKAQGGNINGLTAGAPIPNIITRLAQTLDWAGYKHQVLRKGFTCASRSLFAKGDRQQYRFTAYDSYTSETGGTSTLAWNIISSNKDIADQFLAAYNPGATIVQQDLSGGGAKYTISPVTGAGTVDITGNYEGGTLIIKGLPSLTTLSAVGYDLTAIEVPDTLQYLNVNSNYISSLPPLPPGLILLDCSWYNALRELPPLPATLITLNCSNSNALTSLPTLPSGLKNLDVAGGCLTSADINSILAQLVANGQTNGSFGAVGQFEEGGWPPVPAPPTGQGIADKATLISRGWSVYTD